MQRGSGRLAASGVPGQCRAGEQWSARGSKPESAGVNVSQRLSLALYGKATAGRPRSEPDWGNPTVRDRRGACGNVDHGGTRHPPRVSKERVLETLRLKLRAPQFYPDLLQIRRVLFLLGRGPYAHLTWTFSYSILVLPGLSASSRWPSAGCLGVNKCTVFCRNIKRNIQRYWISRRLCRSISCSASMARRRSA
jgi:hypothetical protein